MTEPPRWHGSWTAAAPTIAAVQDRLAEWLLQEGHIKNFQRDELLTHAQLVRELRNYGVHGVDDDELEEHVTEDQVATILLASHRHVARLDAVIAKTYN